MNLVQLLYQSVLRTPDHECLRFKKNGVYESLTYEQVFEHVMGVAHGLHRLGINAGDKVGIMAENCPEWTISDFAILALGAVVVPIYPTVPTQQATFILRNVDVTWVICGDTHHLHTIAQDFPKQLVGAVLISGDVPADMEKPVHSFSEILALGRQIMGNDTGSTAIDFDAISPKELATIVHTSGTSGVPKGVMLSHRNITSNVQSALSVLSVQSTDISLSYLPLSHIFERTVGQFALLYSGATIAYAEGIESIRDNLLEVHPTILVTVPRLLEKVYAGLLQKLDSSPALIRTLIQHDIKKTVAHKSFSGIVAERLVFSKLREGLGGRIRAVVSGGAGLAKDIAEFYIRAGIPVYEGYGMTESAPVIAANPFGAARPGTVGKPLPGVSVRLDEDGELLVRGPNVMMGYYGQEDETLKTLTSDGWLKTGDLAEMVDGYIRIVDRKKNILVLATGKNVAPFPIENAITLSPYIADAVLIGDGRKYVTCLVVPDFVALTDRADEWGLSKDHPEAFVDARPVQLLLRDELRKSIAPFADFEQPKRAKLLPQPFSLSSGELTPTLKVRTKLILEKYKNEVEAMYEGTDYLDIFGSDDQHIVRVADGESTLEQATKPQRRMWWIIPTAVVMAALLFGIAKAYAFHLPPEYNLPANIAQIGKNTHKINQENAKLVREMGAVSDLDSTTPKIADHLKTIGSGLNHENQNLTQLTTLSQQEIALSKSLSGVADHLHQSLASVDQSSLDQSQSVAEMARLTQAMDQTAAQLTSTNTEILNKLHQASSDTSEISREMP